MRYPVSESLKKAIESLFDDPSIGLEAVGARRILPPDWYRETKDRTTPIEDRAAMLRSCLERSICSMAAENEEYGSVQETARLRAEAMATLVALRELFSHIPEAFDEGRSSNSRSSGSADPELLR